MNGGERERERERISRFLRDLPFFALQMSKDVANSHAKMCTLAKMSPDTGTTALNFQIRTIDHSKSHKKLNICTDTIFPAPHLDGRDCVLAPLSLFHDLFIHFPHLLKILQIGNEVTRDGRTADE